MSIRSYMFYNTLRGLRPDKQFKNMRNLIFADSPNAISEQDQITTPGTPCSTLCDKCVVSLMSPGDHNSEECARRSLCTVNIYLAFGVVAQSSVVSVVSRSAVFIKRKKKVTKPLVLGTTE